MTINADIVHRDDEKDYIKIKNVIPKLSFDDFKMDSKGKHNIVDTSLNIFWPLIVGKVKSSFLNEYFGKMMISILSPIFDRIAIQDFIEE